MTKNAVLEGVCWIGAMALLSTMGLVATNEGVALTAPGISADRLMEALFDIAELPTMDPVSILSDAKNLLREKWDWALPGTLLRKSFASHHLDLPGAQSLARELWHNYRHYGNAAENETLG